MREADFTKASPGQLEAIREGVMAFVPDPLPPPKSAFDPAAVLPVAEEAAMALGGLNNLIQALPNTSVVVKSFLRREAVRSSMIEGTKTQLGQLLLFEVGETPDNPADSEDADQVRRNLEACETGLQLIEKSPLYGGLLRKVHAVLFDGMNRLTKRPGEFRNTSSRIGGNDFHDARFIPPPAEQVPEAMKALDSFVNDPAKHSQLPVLIQSALMHYQFEAIHPFADGNGRIGRLALSLLLRQRGVLRQPILCLSDYMDQHREEYVTRMLGVSQRGDWKRWVEFFLRGVAEQAKDDSARCMRLLELRNTYLTLCDESNVPLAVIDSLFRFPATTVPRVAQALEVSYPTASRYVEALEKCEVLIEVTGRATHRIYLAQPIVDLLERPLGS